MPRPNKSEWEIPYSDGSGQKLQVVYMNPEGKDSWVVIKGLGAREGETAHIEIENLEWLYETIEQILKIEGTSRIIKEKNAN